MKNFKTEINVKGWWYRQELKVNVRMAAAAAAAATPWSLLACCSLLDFPRLLAVRVHRAVHFAFVRPFVRGLVQTAVQKL